MPPIHKTVRVSLAERSYPIVIGSGLLDGGYDLASEIATDCIIVTNDMVGPLYLERVESQLGDKVLASVSLPDGEAHKTWRSVERVIDALAASGAGRDATVVALGGGVVGDIAGFAAASYMRGVSFLQLPTTLLAQVDSSVGGKTGVNHSAGKNLIGAFHQPKLVLIDTATLSTLPDRELSAGLAEVIKHGAILDREYLDWLESSVDALLAREPAALAHAIARSCEIKAEIVARDETERGQRALLNFGHTFGHAIENIAGYGEWLHGEAVAAGMVMAAALSGIDDAEQRRLTGLIAAAQLPIAAPGLNPVALRKAMALDKKVLDKRLRFILLQRLGQAYVSTDVEEQALADVLATACGSAADHGIA